MRRSRLLRLVVGSTLVAMLVACGLEISGLGQATPPVDGGGSEAGRDGPSVPNDADPDTSVEPDAGEPVEAGGPIEADDHVVFVTKTQPKANFGGVSIGDAICQDEATKGKAPAVKGRAFIAWLSDGILSAGGRFLRLTGRYVLPSGHVVAGSYAGLTSGTLLHAIDQNADGVLAPNSRVWTGTLFDGGKSGVSCQSWTAQQGNQSGTSGRVTSTDAAWTEETLEACNDDWPLYCISQ